MTKMEYAQKVANAVGGEVKEVTKNNGIIKTGVVVQNDNGIGVTMYIDEYYEAETSVEEVIDMVSEAVKKQNNVGFDANTLSDYEAIKGQIKCKLINKKRNTHFTVTRSANGYGFPDLIIVPYIEVVIGGQAGSITITESMVENWGVTKRTVIDRAIKNTECEIMSLEEKLGLLMPGMDIGYTPLKFVSTPNNINGAIGIIKAKKKLAEMYPNGYYVIPSSVHEMLVLDASETDESTITNVIQDVNENVLNEMDYLSDHVYTFNVA